MFPKKHSSSSSAAAKDEHLTRKQQHTPEDEQLVGSSGRGSSLAGSQVLLGSSFTASAANRSTTLDASSSFGSAEEKQHFLLSDKSSGATLQVKNQNHHQDLATNSNSAKKKEKQAKKLCDKSSSKSAAAAAAVVLTGKKAKLAKQESIDEKAQPKVSTSTTCRRMRILILVLIISCIAAIYCIPYIEIEPRIPKLLPHIPFNFREAPLQPASLSQFKVEHLFYGQFHAAESVAIDSTGNMYLAVEGGFVLYAHLNASSPIKRQYYTSDNSPNSSPSSLSPSSYLWQQLIATPESNLVKIAELNGIKQIPYENTRRRARDGTPEGASWRRECQLDEKIYGSQLSSGGSSIGQQQQQLQVMNEVDTDSQKNQRFESRVVVSRCSKPLGIRLSRDESYLYVIDTLSGLYRVSLKVSERAQSSQRLVSKLIDFRANKSRQLLPVFQFDQPLVSSLPEPLAQVSGNGAASLATTTTTTTTTTNTNTINTNANANSNAKPTTYLNVSLLAVDDLVIDYGAGTRGSDIIYLSVGSQSWHAVGVIYDMLEGRPTGVVLRYDTGANQLSVLNPTRIAHVRSSIIEPLVNATSRYYSTSPANLTALNNEQLYLGIGAPRLDENDVFDDRPLHFPNGLEQTDDREAILIADTVNKRILKHYIRGARRGTTDLWTWTPNYPDNIRRGYDRRQETYWVVGCGHDNTNQPDYIAWLASWPRLRKYILKNIYLFGWMIENFGQIILRSTSIRDLGYSIKTGHSLCENMCSGMMILQYNKYGDIIRSIYSNEFPNDMYYYSQVNEVIDAQTQEHILYLSSPAYQYVTKLTLPTDSFDIPPPPPPSTVPLKLTMNEIR